MRARLLFGIALASLASIHPARAAEGIEQSVVRVLNYSQRGNWFSPWDTGPLRLSSGSAFVIEGGWLLTNAHVVSDAKMLALYLHGDPNPHEATVVVSGHDCDLALVKPVEKGLLDAIPRLQIGGLPAIRSVVETYGYPAGGDQISSTRGVVSRIEQQTYAHSGVDGHLSIQTDAAINPGNSGGPVVQDGKVVGVAFQGADGLENVGLVIPVEVIRHFLDDLEDGRYDGYPDLAIRESTLENPAARRRQGMSEGESGVRVDFVKADGSADGHLEVGDVILSVDGHPVANDGSVLLDGLRLDYGVLTDRHQIREKLHVKVLRAGERRDVAVPLLGFPHADLHANAYDRFPRYFVYAGLVFVPLELETLKTAGPDWPTSVEKRLVYESILRPLEDPAADRRERIVLLRRLDDPVNINIAWYRNQLVERVNGRTIKGLADLIDAVESNRGRFHVFELAEPGRLVVLEREAADQANRGILERYGVPKDRYP